MLLRLGAVLALAASAGAQGVNLKDPVLNVHATLVYNESPSMHGDLLNKLKAGQDDVIKSGIVTDGLDFHLTDTPPRPQPAQILAHLQRLSCSTDAIVIGETSVRLSHLTASRTSIYTDYDFAVGETLKGTVAQHIVVTRLGGRLEVPSTGPLKVLDFNPDPFPQLQTNTTYLLLVNRVPASGAYVAVDPDATLVALTGQWMFARKAYSGYTLPELARETLENEIRAWAASCR